MSKTYAVKIKDSKPQVGIFEIVEGELLIDSEDTQQIASGFFDGLNHRHDQDVKRLVKHSSRISDKTKARFEANPAEYLNWPRGRVDYDCDEKKWHIMASAKLLNDGAAVEKIARAFYLPPMLSGKLVLEADEGHYGY